MMMAYNRAVVAAAVGVWLLAGGGVGLAQDLAAVKGRMDARAGDVQKWKQDKVIGETNDGYLAVVKTGAEASVSALVGAENSDRKQVYQAMAAKQGVTIEQVGKNRAAQIRAKAVPGIMLQKEDGSWEEKR